jgi:hypothetical protein
MSPPGKKRSPSPWAGRWQRLKAWYAGPGGMLLFCLALVGTFFAAAYFAWQKVGPAVLRSEDYALSPENFDLPPPPRWIQTDLREEVFRELNRDRRPSILDQDLAERIAAAFQRQPWIAGVQKVRPLPTGHVEIDLTYRRPVLMVEMPGGLLPLAVDAQGILLPTSGFTPPEAAKYPRLSGVDRPPLTVAGQRWMDNRVLGGAEIAAALMPVWENYQLQRIVPLTENLHPGSSALLSPAEVPRRSGDYSFVIFTRRGKRIVWGIAPAKPGASGPSPDQKVEKLRALAAEYGSLDHPTAPQEIDLRKP